MAWSEKAIDHGALMLCERDNSAGAACEPRCEMCKLIAKQVIDAAARVDKVRVNAVDGDAQWNAALRDVAAERRRQTKEEGWSTDHDDTQRRGELAMAAQCYTYHAAIASQCVGDGIYKAEDVDAAMINARGDNGPPPDFPWSLTWWKPKNRRRDLVRAAALIVAEIERLDRAARKSEGENDGVE
jgi:hypothetical protein